MSYFHVLYIIPPKNTSFFKKKEAKSYYYEIHNLLSEFEFT